MEIQRQRDLMGKQMINDETLTIEEIKEILTDREFMNPVHPLVLSAISWLVNSYEIFHGGDPDEEEVADET